LAYERLSAAKQYTGITVEQMFAVDEAWAKAARAKGYDAIVLMAKVSFQQFKREGNLPRSIELNVLVPTGA
jgi:hypothetical protein